MRLATSKRDQSVRPSCFHSYWQRHLDAAHANVPQHIVQQINLDVPRTFSALPEPQGLWTWPLLDIAEPAEAKAHEELLARVLLAHEWRAMCRTKEQSSDDELRTTYVQGVNLLAAMCVGFVGGREEEGYWLLLYLTEDVLGQIFFTQTPPLVGYQGDRAACAALVAAEAPRITDLLGPRGLAEAVSLLAARCFLSGFVGCLASEPLIAFWEQLLQKHNVAYPRFPLLHWLVGIIVKVEDELLEFAADCSPCEVGPLFFRHVQQAGRALPNGWRPSFSVSAQRVMELRQTADEVSQKYRQSFEAQEQRETHVKAVNESLDRASARFLDVMQSANALAALGSQSSSS